MSKHTSTIAPAIATPVYDTFWRFAAERQDILFRRLSGLPPPWTDDLILKTHKFTNVYRATDRVSQYLIRSVIYGQDQDPNEVFFRIILFKLFNKIETWELLTSFLGPVSYSRYSFERYDSVLSQALQRGERIYSAAYIMPAEKSSGYSRKHRGHLKLIERMMEDGVPMRIAASRTMQEVFALLRSYPSIGDFLAYQYAIDINYSQLTNFGESEFVVAGPGARDGIRKCLTDTGGLSDEEVIRLITDIQEQEFERLGLSFRTLWGRRLQFIDCQNLFCEVGKYARVSHPDISGISGRLRIKQRFAPKRGRIDLWFPPKWGINDIITR